MKQTRFNKKLVIKKVTISNLTKEQQLSVRGGGTLQGDTCEGTVQGRTCDEYSTAAACQ